MSVKVLIDGTKVRVPREVIVAGPKAMEEWLQKKLATNPFKAASKAPKAETPKKEEAK